AVVDVSDHAAVAGLAEAAAGLGPVTRLIHTAGLSPAKSGAAAILAGDLAGGAYSVEEFGKVIPPGGAGGGVAGMAGTRGASALTREMEHALTVTPADDLLSLPFLSPEVMHSAGGAYSLAKRGNQLRMAAAALAWGQRGARINSISPGIIATRQGRDELAGDS